MLEHTEGPLEVSEVELAPPGPGEVLVRLHASGVCHSDQNAIDGTAQVRPGDRVAVIGCGGVGLSALLGAIAAGAGTVVANPSKLDVARELGADEGVLWTGSAEETAAAVAEASGGGVDYAIEATGRCVIEATHDIVVLVAVWVDPAADDETALSRANRESVRKAIGMCVEERDPDAVARLVAGRDSVISPFYGGG